MGTDIKRMAELLKSGATMLSETCPVCSTPLFKLGKEVFCPTCNRPVVIVQTSEEEARVIAERTLETIERTLMAKMEELNVAIRVTDDLSRLQELGNVLNTYLMALERARKLRAA